MTTKGDATYLEEVLGDVVGSFCASIKMDVYFKANCIVNGYTMKPSMAVNAPAIRIYGQSGHLYTLLMIDPDMPSPSNPTMREWIHWMITDIPGDSCNLDHGKEIMPYMPPTPTRGIHRYILMLYDQKSPLGLVEPPTSREKFDSKNFAQTHDLGDPQSVFYFVAKREPLNKNR